MNRYTFPTAAMLVTLGAAIVLPQLYSVHSSSARQQAAPASASYAPWALDNDNIVDALKALPLTLPIRHVEWDTSMMAIDLQVTDKEISADEIYKNMSLIFSFSFQETVNVDQVLLRMVAEDKWLGTKHLLLAADVRRSEWTPELNDILEEYGSDPLPTLLKRRFHMTETNLWKNQFRTDEFG